MHTIIMRVIKKTYSYDCAVVYLIRLGSTESLYLSPSLSLSLSLSPPLSLSFSPSLSLSLFSAGLSGSVSRKVGKKGTEYYYSRHL